MNNTYSDDSTFVILGVNRFGAKEVMLQETGADGMPNGAIIAVNREQFLGWEGTSLPNMYEKEPKNLPEI
jgi:hypothetical protein